MSASAYLTVWAVQIRFTEPTTETELTAAAEPAADLPEWLTQAGWGSGGRSFEKW